MESKNFKNSGSKGMVYGLWLRGDDFTRHVSVKESTTTFL